MREKFFRTQLFSLSANHLFFSPKFSFWFNWRMLDKWYGKSFRNWINGYEHVSRTSLFIILRFYSPETLFYENSFNFVHFFGDVTCEREQKIGFGRWIRSFLRRNEHWFAIQIGWLLLRESCDSETDASRSLFPLSINTETIICISTNSARSIMRTKRSDWANAQVKCSIYFAGIAFIFSQEMSNIVSLQGSHRNSALDANRALKC